MTAFILAIDDDAAVRHAIKEVLAEAGYHVTCAEHGKEGLRAFRDHKPDLIITDIFMPETDGIETIIQLRSIWPNGPIIAMSGGGQARRTDLLAVATKLGAKATLWKPFDAGELLSAVTRCLRAA